MNENEKKGFTLIELLGILVLIAIIGIIVFVVIDRTLKNGKESAYEKQIRMIELATENWASDNYDKLPDEGKSITLTLAGLKMLGYVELDVSDPITGKCFPNDTKIVISKWNGQYSYKVDRDSIANGVMACDTFDDDGNITTETPLISIEGGENTLSISQTTIFTIVSNISGLDTSKIKLVNSLDSYEETTFSCTTSCSEIVNLGQEVLNESGTGYEREVTILAGEKNQTIWLIVEKGALVNSDGVESEIAISSSIVIDNIVPDVTDDSASIISYCKDGLCPNSSSANDNNYCMDKSASYTWLATSGSFHTELGYGGILYDAEQSITLKVFDENPTKYTVYTYEDGSRKDIVTNTIDIGNDIVFSTWVNGTYYIDVCDVNDNCEQTGPYDMKFNDCKNPEVLESANGSTLISNYFVDVADTDMNYNNIAKNSASDVDIVGAVVAPPHLEHTLFLSYYNIDSYSMESLEDKGYTFYNGDTINNKTYNELQSQAYSDNFYNPSLTGDLYLYLMSKDEAGNLGFNSQYVVSVSSSEDNYYIVSSSEDEYTYISGSGYICDAKCQMINNSKAWYSCDGNATCEATLNANNQYLCSQIPECGYYNETTGYWMTATNSEGASSVIEEYLYDLHSCGAMTCSE